MEYKKCGGAILARIDKGEEIIEQVEKLARAEGIRLAGVQALGAVKSFTAGVYDVEKKAFLSHEF